LSFYPADLARIHDEGFGDFARAAACELLRRMPGRGGLVVELGCGTGIGAEIVSGAGYDVLGIDLSEDMLAIARRRAPGARFQQGSIWDAELPTCAAVTAIGEVVNYAADDRAGAGALPELCERVYAALQPGGLFLFDFATPGRGTGVASTREGDGWRIESVATEDPATQTLQRRMTIESGGARREELHALHLYEADVVRQSLDGAGFACEALDAYCDFGFWPGYAAFAARKPGVGAVAV
jgi:SAM-dependent methyltransferase